MIRENNLKQFVKRYKMPVFLLAAFIVGFGIRGIGRGPAPVTTPVPADTAGQAEVQEWTCSMHPQIRQPKPGKCPLCGMDLIPVVSEQGSDALSPGEIRLSPQAAKLAEVRVSPVERRGAEKEIRLVGKVDYDETRRKAITAWIPGRIDRVYVDFTGTSVRAGEPLVNLYSPELLTAQEELIQAKRAAREMENSPLETMRETALRTVESSREKLRLLGLSSAQIQRIESSGKPDDHVTVNSPLSGVVIEKNAVEGMYVDTGMMLYSIADLSSVWVKLDVYESDLQWVRLGQRVDFTSEAWPGEVFAGKVSFIDPVLDNMTRTVKVRVNAPNPGGKLKPDMFVRSVLRANLGLTAQGLPLVIPASAPLLTGKRAVVYVAVPGKETTYEGREVTLGSRAGDYYEVKQGLSEGEMIVVNGAFKIDSAVQILARPSMMDPSGGGAVPSGHNHGTSPAPPANPNDGHGAQPGGVTPGSAATGSGRQAAAPVKPGSVPPEFKAQLDCLYSGYFTIQDALSRDNLNDARKAAGNLVKEVPETDMALLKGATHDAWMQQGEMIRKNAGAMAAAKDLEAARTAFLSLSRAIMGVAENFGASGKIPVYRFHCPMADNNRGADWLQRDQKTRNPYFGSSMLTCGEMTGTVSSGNGKS
ncbi:MAG: efflux RND transporter periplasmic adaptor subunit [Candidatus Latescibacterota bacterium]